MFPHKRTSNQKIISLFLHKLDILNKILNGLFQKRLAVVTKLCAVRKLGDLTGCDLYCDGRSVPPIYPEGLSMAGAAKLRDPVNSKCSKKKSIAFRAVVSLWVPSFQKLRILLS